MKHLEWWRGAVIYQIYPLSFHDGNGDGIGDLPGIVAKLDYVASLGVDAIWVAPFFRSPMRDFGYDVADHRDVDPAFGTLEDFDLLVARAHALGIRVIIDQVWGHTSDAHSWFTASRSSRNDPASDWYVWADPCPDGTAPNNWLSVFGGTAWRWEPRRRQYYLHHFLDTQPTLNLRNPAVVDALLETARFWLARGVDGFRLDAVDFLLHDPLLRDNPPAPPPGGIIPAKPFGLQQHIHDMVQPEVTELLRTLRALADEYPGTALLGEVSSQDGAYARIARYTAAGEGLHMAYTLRPLRREAAHSAIGEALAEIDAASGDGWVCWAFSNHDVERVASRWNPARRHGGPPSAALVQQLHTLLVTLGGTACAYQGEELGLEEAVLDVSELRDPFGIAFYPEFRSRDGARTPQPWQSDTPHAGFTTGEPWLPVPREHFAASVADQETDPNSALHSFRRLLRWRRSHPALRCGRLERVDLPAPLLGFYRVDDAQRILLVFNLGAQPIIVPLDGLGRLKLLEHGMAQLDADGIATLPPFGIFAAALEAGADSRQDRLVAVG